MSDRFDYLYDKEPLDRSSEADREVEALERLFAPLAHDGRGLPPDFLVATSAPRARRWLLPLFSLAAALLLLVGWLATRRGDDGSVELQPGDTGRSIVARDTVRAVRAEGVLVAELQAGGELRVLGFDDARVSLQLVRGRVRIDVPSPATKGAPALQFASANATLEPLGFEPCLLQLDADGQLVVLRVERGEIAGRCAGREFVVPAGASWTVRGGLPGWPLFDDSRDALREAVDMAFAFEAKAGAEVLGKAAYGIVTAAKSPRDTLVLWHLLQLEEAASQAGVQARLIELAGTPGKVPAKAWSRDTWLEHLRAVAWRSPK